MGVENEVFRAANNEWLDPSPLFARWYIPATQFPLKKARSWRLLRMYDTMMDVVLSVDHYYKRIAVRQKMPESGGLWIRTLGPKIL